jgi:predicted TPR repeat methyltransferase
MTDGWAAAYDAIAPGYDDDTRGAWWANEHVAELLAPLALTPARVLDLGAGTGQTAMMLSGLFPDAELTLVDPSAGMAGIARAKLPDATVVVSDAADFLRAAGGGWDLVTAVGCLELVPDLFEVLRLAASRLAPGGHLAVTHEPLWGTSVQSRPRSRLDGGRLVQRHPREEVERRAASYGLVRVASRDAAMFTRGDEDGDAVNEVVVWTAERGGSDVAGVDLLAGGADVEVALDDHRGHAGR